MEDKKILHLVNEAIVYKIKKPSLEGRNTGRGFTKEEIQQLQDRRKFFQTTQIYFYCE